MERAMNQPRPPPRYSFVARLVGSLVLVLMLAVFVLGIVAAIGGSVQIVRHWIL